MCQYHQNWLIFLVLKLCVQKLDKKTELRKGTLNRVTQISASNTVKALKKIYKLEKVDFRKILDLKLNKLGPPYTQV